jgi:hypothetical protein
MTRPRLDRQELHELLRLWDPAAPGEAGNPQGPVGELPASARDAIRREVERQSRAWEPPTGRRGMPLRTAAAWGMLLVTLGVAALFQRPARLPAIGDRPPGLAAGALRDGRTDADRADGTDPADRTDRTNPADPADRRPNRTAGLQIQFIAPAGTRIVWVLDAGRETAIPVRPAAAVNR